MTAETCDGVLEILNVQGGDTKLTFNKEDVGEMIRTKRIIEDLLRRGYALVVEVERDGERKYERVQQFDANAGEYIIADMDPLRAHEADMEEGAARLSKQQEQEEVAARKAMYAADFAADPSNISAPAPVQIPLEDTKLCHCGRPKGHRGAHAKTKRLPMEKTRATAIGRSAGG